MKKLVFPVVLALVAMFSFNSCTPEGDPSVKMKENIIKNASYTGKDSKGEAWVATITATTFTMSCPTSSLSITCANWDVKANVDGKTGVITLKKVTLVKSDGNIEKDEIKGDVLDSGAKIAFKLGETVINLSKK